MLSDAFVSSVFGTKKRDGDRDRQIRELTVAFPSLRRPVVDQKDINVFEILFDVNRSYSTLRITLNTSFPGTKPVLQIIGPLNHSWLDANKVVVGCDLLTNWSRTSSLVDVVRTTLSVLQGGVNITPSNIPPTSQTQTGGSLFPIAQYQDQQRPLPHAVAVTTSSSSSVGNNQPNQSQYASYQLPSSSSQNHHGFNNINGSSVAAGQTIPQQPPPYSTMMSTSMSRPPPAYEANFMASRDSPFPSQSSSHSLQLPPTSSSSSSHSSQSLSLSQRTQPTTTIPPIPAPTTIPAPAPLVRELSSEIKIPTIPSDFPELQALTETQLTRLLRDEMALEAMVTAITGVESMASLLEQLRDSNVQEAMVTMSDEEKVSKLYNEITALQSTLQNDTNHYQQQLHIFSNKYTNTASSCQQQLHQRKTSLKKTSEQLGTLIESGEKDTTELLNLLHQYELLRKQYHTCGAIEEALHVPMHQQQQQHR